MTMAAEQAISLLCEQLTAAILSEAAGQYCEFHLTLHTGLCDQAAQRRMVNVCCATTTTILPREKAINFKKQMSDDQQQTFADVYGPLL